MVKGGTLVQGYKVTKIKKSTKVQKYTSTRVHKYNSRKVQENQNTRVQKEMSIRVQEYNITIIK